MARIRVGDMVEVLAGNDRGKRGRILRIIPKRQRVVVQGVNMRWKHMRKSQQYPQGGRVQRETPFHISNVMFYDEDAGARTRLGYTRQDGRKLRVSVKSGKPVTGVREDGGKKAKED